MWVLACLQDDFHVKAEIIRDKAINIYQTFKLLFCTTSEAPFSSTFNAEVGKFNHAVALAGFSGKAAIGLYEEPTQPLLESESRRRAGCADEYGRA